MSRILGLKITSPLTIFRHDCVIKIFRGDNADRVIVQDSDRIGITETAPALGDPQGFSLRIHGLQDLRLPVITGGFSESQPSGVGELIQTKTHDVVFLHPGDTPGPSIPEDYTPVVIQNLQNPELFQLGQPREFRYRRMALETKHFSCGIEDAVIQGGFSSARGGLQSSILGLREGACNQLGHYPREVIQVVGKTDETMPEKIRGFVDAVSAGVNRADIVDILKTSTRQARFREWGTLDVDMTVDHVSRVRVLLEELKLNRRVNRGLLSPVITDLGVGEPLHFDEPGRGDIDLVDVPPRHKNTPVNAGGRKTCLAPGGRVSQESVRVDGIDVLREFHTERPDDIQKCGFDFELAWVPRSAWKKPGSS